MEKLEDIYDTPEFKALPKWKRVRLRLWFSFLASIEMF